MNIQLNDVMIHQAQKSIIAMVREANKAGGYKSVAKKLAEKEEGLSVHIYGMALSASKQGRGKLDTVLEWFLALCRASEAHLKAVSQKELGYTIENVKDELPCWPTFKSEIKRAITAGLDPKDFETFNKLKAARKAKEEQAGRQAHHNDADGEGREAADGGTNVAAGVGKTKVTPTLAATLTIMQRRIEGMTDEQQDAFAARLSVIMLEFEDSTKTDEEPAEVASGEAQEAAGEDESERQSA